MDRNSAIGLTLIAALLLVYFYWFTPTPPPKNQEIETAGEVARDTVKKETAVTDSALTATYGDLSTAMKGSESFTTVETQDLRVVFSSKGGVPREVELKHYKTYGGEPLRLITPETNTFNLLTQYQGRNIDFYALYYEVDQQKRGDTTDIVYKVSLANGLSITQTYKIPQSGYSIEYDINSDQLAQAASDLNFKWNNTVQLLEKDITDSRLQTTITYLLQDGDFDELAVRSSDTEVETFEQPVKWVTIKEKFFLAGFIAKSGAISGGQLQTSQNEDPQIVKFAKIDLGIPKKALAGKNDFRFYFGPNDYQMIGKVAEDYQKNVYLGWPPVHWINKYVIFPVFHFLTKTFSNYGVIIIILVILLRIVLFPLSYKSYLSMAKMRLLKPELDTIKERVGDDMTKIQQEQMKLYQQVGVNPISGCIPVLLQMPIVLAMFYLFPASIELRQQPLLWAEDLSTYDSLIRLPFVVPFLGSHISLFTVIMTATTLISVWQNNQMSAVQGPMKSVSYVMPLIFFFMLNSFSAGLTFYYTVSTLLTFAQQAIIKQFVDEDKIKAAMEENRKRSLAGGGKKSKFMTRLNEAMKASEDAKKKAEDERRKRKDGRK